jgi:hypothetical protein
MKKLLLLSLFALPLAALAQPQCTPDTGVWAQFAPSGVNSVGAPPSEIVQDNRNPSVFPDMVAGQYYEEVLKFVFAQRIDTTVLFQTLRGTVNSVTVLDVLNLPAGLTNYVVSGNSANTNGQASSSNQILLTPVTGNNFGPYGCATVYGTVPSGVQADATDSITIGVVVEVAFSWNPNVPGETPATQRDTAFYRAKYIDQVGQADNLAARVAYTVAPNPVAHNTTANFTLVSPATVGLQVADLSGRVVYNQPAQRMAAGSHSLPLPYDLPAGVFLAQLMVDGQVATVKVVK